MKTFAGYQFFNENCPKKSYVIFHDDDVFIKLNELRGQMNKIPSDEAHIKCLKGTVCRKRIINHFAGIVSKQDNDWSKIIQSAWRTKGTKILALIYE